MTTWQGLVAAGTDDATETDNGSGFSTVSSPLVITEDTNAAVRANGGIRFVTTVPAGATINSATLDVIFNSTARDSPQWDIYIEDDDGALDYVGEADVTSRAPLTSGVSWAAANLGTSRVSSPDLAAIIQTVVSRAGFTGVLNIICKGKNQAVGETGRPIARDGSATNCAQLTIDYSTGGAGSGPLISGGLVGEGIVNGGLIE